MRALAKLALKLSLSGRLLRNPHSSIFNKQVAESSQRISPHAHPIFFYLFMIAEGAI
jgi:hypothetical protein